MHEVSFQDKEKEHLTRLQDAEEMKVRAAWPRSPARISTEFSGSRNTRLLQHWCGSAGGSGEGPQPAVRAGLRAWPVQEWVGHGGVLKPWVSGGGSHVASVGFSVLCRMKREGAAPPGPCPGHTVGLTPEEMLGLPLNGRKQLSPLPFSRNTPNLNFHLKHRDLYFWFQFKQ